MGVGYLEQPAAMPKNLLRCVSFAELIADHLVDPSPDPRRFSFLILSHVISSHRLSSPLFPIPFSISLLSLLSFPSLLYPLSFFISPLSSFFSPLHQSYLVECLAAHLFANLLPGRVRPSQPQPRPATARPQPGKARPGPAGQQAARRDPGVRAAARGAELFARGGPWTPRRPKLSGLAGCVGVRLSPELSGFHLRGFPLSEPTSPLYDKSLTRGCASQSTDPSREADPHVRIWRCMNASMRVKGVRHSRKG